MTSESIDPDTLDFILDATKGGPADQFRNMESYDSKIIRVFAAASIIIGLTQVTQGSGESLPGIVLCAIIGLYVTNIVALIYGLWPRTAYAVFHSDTMWETHRQVRLNALKFVFWGFQSFAIEKVFAQADTRNRQSIRVMEKCGMKQEAFLRKHRHFRGEQVDEIWCGLLREEWEQATPSQID